MDRYGSEAVQGAGHSGRQEHPQADGSAAPAFRNAASVGYAADSVRFQRALEISRALSAHYPVLSHPGRQIYKAVSLGVRPRLALPSDLSALCGLRNAVLSVIMAYEARLNGPLPY